MSKQANIREIVKDIVIWFKSLPAGTFLDYTRVSDEIRRRYPHLGEDQIDYAFSKVVMIVASE